ncbi:hypothetical protein KKF81_07485 [Candidatus Micrarchaeota archaeon]|nr:hypothetical protein [Candidatus Micrarchaeota archaeon]MBU1166772.1 hypothetical protein [Candidatus Micrarchaeota archaeon]MBU1887230.1 hypothetical protein [Candidatus Micrarchaeota archaeon]
MIVKRKKDQRANSPVVQTPTIFIGSENEGGRITRAMQRILPLLQKVRGIRTILDPTSEHFENDVKKRKRIIDTIRAKMYQGARPDKDEVNIEKMNEDISVLGMTLTSDPAAEVRIYAAKHLADIGTDDEITMPLKSEIVTQLADALKTETNEDTHYTIVETLVAIAIQIRRNRSGKSPLWYRARAILLDAKRRCDDESFREQLGYGLGLMNGDLQVDEHPPIQIDEGQE